MGERAELIDGSRPFGLWDCELLSNLDGRVVDGEAKSDDAATFLGDVAWQEQTPLGVGHPGITPTIIQKS